MLLFAFIYVSICAVVPHDACKILHEVFSSKLTDRADSKRFRDLINIGP